MSAVVRQGRMMLEMVRFSHTIFALPFAMLASAMALAVPLRSGEVPLFRFQDLIGILCCMVFARTAAMAFNRIVDRDFDLRNPRTAKRHLPAGTISLRGAIMLTTASSLGFLAATLLFLPNPLPLLFAVPILLLLLGYSLSKRFTSAAHLWLGIALSLSPICAWVAIRGLEVWSFPLDLLPPSILALGVASWVAGFDIIYACQDAEFDRQMGLHSIPARYGIGGGLRIAACLHAGTLFFLLMLPLTSEKLGLAWLYYGAVLGIGGLLWYEHSLVREDQLDRVGVAFFQCNALISVILLVAGGIDCWWI